MLKMFMCFMFTMISVWASGEPPIESTPEKRARAHLRKLFLDDVASYTDMDEAVSFYTYTPPRPLEEIENELITLQKEILELMNEAV